MAFQKSILAGVDGLIEKWCGLTDPSRFGTTDEPRYGSIQAAKDLSKNGGPLASAVDADAPKLLQEILDLIAKNHDSTGSGQATPVVWKLRKVPSLDAKNESAEKVLEKLVVMLLGPEWSNQVAVASGYIPGAVSDKKRAIDLVHDCGNGEFEFIELKYGDATQRYGSNTPLYAAWEIVLYGLLYAHARKQTARSDASPLLQAKKIHLMVLAPKGYYAAFNLERRFRLFAKRIFKIGSRSTDLAKRLDRLSIAVRNRHLQIAVTEARSARDGLSRSTASPKRLAGVWRHFCLALISIPTSIPAGRQSTISSSAVLRPRNSLIFGLNAT